MKKLLLAGDTHGDKLAVINLMEAAKELNADLFILGDFGFWEHTPSGKMFLSTIEKASLRLGVIVRFLDGNHDNHPVLWSMYGRGRKDPVKVRSGLYYHGRGLRWEWDGVNFMSLGGAVSIDREYREPWISWWRSEMIEPEDVTYSLRSGNVDVLLMHDAPDGLDDVFTRDNPFFKIHHKDSALNRSRLTTVMNIVKPDFLVHGHMHVDHRTQLGDVQVDGLANTDGWNGVEGVMEMTLEDGMVSSKRWLDVNG